MDKLLFFGIMLLFALLCAGIAYIFFYYYRQYHTILKRSADMHDTILAEIVKIRTVRKRNRTFRWTNEYPVLEYRVNDKTYQCEVTYGERARGTYKQGGKLEICYVADDPQVCVVKSLYPTLKRYSTIYLILTILLGWMAFGMLFQGVYYLFTNSLFV